MENSEKHSVVFEEWLHPFGLLELLVKNLQKLFLPLNAHFQLLVSHLVQALLIYIDNVIGGSCVLVPVMGSLADIILVQGGRRFLRVSLSICLLPMNSLLGVQVIGPRSDC